MRKVTPERMTEFERRKNADGTDEDAYEWLSRQIAMAAAPNWSGFSCCDPADANQQRAMELAVQAKVAYRTRFATIAALMTSTGAVVVAIVAILAKT